MARKEQHIEKANFIFGRESEGVLYGQEQRNPHLMRVNLIFVGPNIV